MECHPEEDDHSKDEAKADDAFLRLGRRHLLYLFLSRSLVLLDREHLLVCASAQEINKDGGDDRDTSDGKGKVIRVGLAVTERRLRPVHNLDGSSRGEQSTHVDGHIEEGEARVAFVGKLRSVVEVAHHHLQVALEQTCSETDEQQGCAHSSDGNGAAAKRNGQQQIAEEHNHDADDYHLAIAPAVGSHASDEGKEIDGSQKPSVNLACRTSGKAEILTKKECKDSEHRVVTETFAGVGKGKCPQAFRLSFEHSLFDLS